MKSLFLKNQGISKEDISRQMMSGETGSETPARNKEGKEADVDWMNWFIPWRTLQEFANKTAADGRPLILWLGWGATPEYDVGDGVPYIVTDLPAGGTETAGLHPELEKLLGG